MISKPGKGKQRWETSRRTHLLALIAATTCFLLLSYLFPWGRRCCPDRRSSAAASKAGDTSSTLSRSREGANRARDDGCISRANQFSGLLTMKDWCILKARIVSDNFTDAALAGALQTKRNVYVGSAGQQWFGWESYSQEELDVTVHAHFLRYFCPGDVQAFLSEHTFEHIPEADTRRAFSYFYEFLAPGGHLRVAMPSYPAGHKGSPIDAKYGHVNFLSADALVQMLESIGFEKVEKLEWVEHGKGIVHTRYWNICEGPVRRSVQLDDRSQAHLLEICHSVNRSEGRTPPGVNSFLATNAFPEKLVAKSSIVQGYKQSSS